MPAYPSGTGPPIVPLSFLSYVYVPLLSLSNHGDMQIVPSIHLVPLQWQKSRVVTGQGSYLQHYHIWGLALLGHSKYTTGQFVMAKAAGSEAFVSIL
ncbi:hypothetical protein QQF64_030397 [Cirrhinus molitorella]|uniref:Uncharacterized protein n=1 Tax=Cirrhinus molitorella TaxID=172907 RepID=A0ABR3N3I3_9TELE